MVMTIAKKKGVPMAATCSGAAVTGAEMCMSSVLLLMLLGAVAVV